VCKGIGRSSCPCRRKRSGNVERHPSFLVEFSEAPSRIHCDQCSSPCNSKMVTSSLRDSSNSCIFGFIQACCGWLSVLLAARARLTASSELNVGTAWAFFTGCEECRLNITLNSAMAAPTARHCAVGSYLNRDHSTSSQSSVDQRGSKNEMKVCFDCWSPTLPFPTLKANSRVSALRSRTRPVFFQREALPFRESVCWCLFTCKIAAAGEPA
jgi:hypothetical protein